MKLGGLFSGVGGFELAWTRLGGQVAWLCESDPKARQVLETRFPDVPIYGDVRDLDPATVEAVDVLTGGSPCQGFSVAGTRSGLVWENVPGVLSIQNDDGEMTFEHVVAALVGAEQPVRLERDKRWNTGMAARGSRAVAWRVLDSRHFGVAQRRRRIFACVAFGHSCENRVGRTLLAVAEGVPRHLAPSGKERRWAADNSRNSVAISSVARTLKESVDDSSQTLLARKVRSDEFVEDDTSSTLAARDYKDYGDLVLERETFDVDNEPYGFSHGNSEKAYGIAVRQGISPPIRAASGGNSTPTVGGNGYGVRRLTPVECERLQSFPDGWTEPAGSDAARYKAMGNAVTVNVVEWVLRRAMANMSHLSIKS